MKLTFLGGAGTVTGSKYLIENGRSRIMVDCGLFQGRKELRLKNWAALPVDPALIDAVLLTHAHIDHSGYLPLLVRNGFKGRIYCSLETRELCEILLPDSGFLHEKDADFANRHGFSKHHPALPLYTEQDARRSLEHFTSVKFGQPVELPGFEARFQIAGHILGAAIIELRANGHKLVFSGDLGRQHSPTMMSPAQITETDTLIVESTYGDRLHNGDDPEDMLADVINRTVSRGGTVLVPAFAVGRTQTLLYHVWRLKKAGRIPDVPVFLDSPMAIDASEIFFNHRKVHRLNADECRALASVATFTHEVEDSKRLDADSVPKIIISASGMATGGRVLHHLKRFAPDRRSTVLFTGFQAPETRGAKMIAGAETIRMHGQDVPVRAEVDIMDMLSAHADADEIMAWLKGFKHPPRRTYITHGEAEASKALKERIDRELKWKTHIPELGEEVSLR